MRVSDSEFERLFAALDSGDPLLQDSALSELRAYSNTILAPSERR